MSLSKVIRVQSLWDEMMKDFENVEDVSIASTKEIEHAEKEEETHILFEGLPSLTLLTDKGFYKNFKVIGIKDGKLNLFGEGEDYGERELAPIDYLQISDLATLHDLIFLK